MLPNDRRSTSPSLRTFDALPSRGWGVPTKVWGRRRMPDTLQRVNWSLVISLRRLVKLRCQANYGRRTKHTAVCLPASAEEGWAGHSCCLVPSEGRMNWVICHRSPAVYVILGWSFGLADKSNRSKFRSKVTISPPSTSIWVTEQNPAHRGIMNHGG